MTEQDQLMHEVYAEEFWFISSLIGPQGALFRLAGAYDLSLESMRTKLRKAGIHIQIDAREVPA